MCKIICDSVQQDQESVSSNYNVYHNFGKVENGGNIEWQMHNSISDVSVSGCRHNHKIVIMR